ncbi:MAG: histidine kinase N-terminal 7TM domain-containing protein [Anaerolineales bacterium]
MQQTPYLIPWYISIALTLSAGIYALRHKKNFAAIPFVAMCFFATWWTVGYVFELGSTNLDIKLLAVKLEYIGILGVSLSWTAFALAYTRRGDWLTTKNIILACILPIITLIILWNTENNHMMFSEISLTIDPVSNLIIIWNPPGWWFWVHAAYVYGILSFGTFFLIQQFWTSQNVYRSQALINIIAVITPWIANGLVVFRMLPVQIDITSITFSFSILFLGWGIFRYHLLDIIPIAHRAIFDSISDAIIILDQSLRVAELNPAAIKTFNLDTYSAIGNPFRVILGNWIDLDDTALKTHGYHREIVLSEHTQQKWFDLYISTLNDGPNNVLGSIITLRDVTSLKENQDALAIARDEAMHANSFKTQLLANVSHELRTPLSVISGYIDLLSRGSYGEVNDKQNTIYNRIKDSSQYLDSLVSELLDQAQLDSGRLKLSSAFFEPREVFGQVCNQLSILAESKNLSFTADISREIPVSLYGDSQRLKQILVNLISNAIKFTEQGNIDVKIFLASETSWGMQVQDTGQGIPDKAVEIIFEPFKQLDQAAKSIRKGYGLGLSITKQLVELMGGNIAMESTQGIGTTFKIILPLKTELD